MHRISGRLAGGLGLALAVLLASPFVASASPTLQRLSTDPFHNSTSQHRTEVEPDIVSSGSTLVGAFQVGRVAAGGAADIGWATSRDGGSTWTHGFLPGLTTFEGGGHNSAVSDPAVAYDPAHGRWLIVSLPISGAGQSVAVNSSPDGLHWSKPVQVVTPTGLDKTWITCDGTSTSAFYGHCYAEWDNAGAGDVVQMSTSTDGGQTWSTPVSPPGAQGLAGEPLAQPNGTVVVPFLAAAGTIDAYRSADGGTTWTAPVVVASAAAHLDPGGFRGGPLPSAGIDAGGRVYVTWESCLFESSCTTNDAVLSSSIDGLAWSAPIRLPTNPAGSSVDVAIPGIGVDRSTQGAAAHLGIVYYDFSNVRCTLSTCRLNVGFISSSDGGATWSTPQQLAGPMLLTWLAASQNGRMVGDYFATAFSGGKAFPIFAVGKKPAPSLAFDEAIYTVRGGLTVS